MTVAVLVRAARATTGAAPPVIEVDEPAALVDQAVHLRITGLDAGESVEVGMEGRAAPPLRRTSTRRLTRPTSATS